MGWETIEKRPRGEHMGTVSSVSLTVKQVMIRLAGELAKGAGLAAQSCVTVQRGTDDDAGRLRILPSAQGFKLRVVNAKSGALRCAVSRWPGLTAAPAAAIHVTAVALDGGGIELVLPKWAAPRREGPAPAAGFADVERRATKQFAAPPLLDSGKGAKIPARRSV